MSPDCVIDGGRSGLYSRRFAGKRSRTSEFNGRATGTPTAGRGRRGRCRQNSLWHSQPRKLITHSQTAEKSACLEAGSRKFLWHDQRIRRSTRVMRRTRPFSVLCGEDNAGASPRKTHRGSMSLACGGLFLACGRRGSLLLALHFGPTLALSVGDGLAGFGA